MNIREAISHVLKEQHMTRAALAERLGVTAPAVTMALNGKSQSDMTVGKASEMLTNANYVLVAVPEVSTGRLPKGSVVIDG